MLFALVITLASTPSAGELAENGGLRGALVKVQLEGQPAGSPFAAMSREELRREYRRLEEDRPPIAGAVMAIALGGGALGIGAITTWISGLVALTSRLPLIPFAVGIGLAAGGAIVLIIGIVMLRAAIAERKPFNDAMDEVRGRLDGTWEAPTPSYPARDDGPVAPVPPPPPPLPPPSADFGVRPSLVLATF
ncbi:MAG: hypothetical protein JNK82_33235 [Myxococcaceae bacterium]|nr:hypothetical protein [Myxococcaceae bacterium]